VDVLPASSVGVEVPEVDLLRGRLDLLFDDEGLRHVHRLAEHRTHAADQLLQDVLRLGRLAILVDVDQRHRATPHRDRAFQDTRSTTSRVLDHQTYFRVVLPFDLPVLDPGFGLLRFFLRLVEDLLGLLREARDRLIDVRLVPVRHPGDLGLHRRRDLALRNVDQDPGSALVQSPRSGRRSAAACPKYELPQHRSTAA
jgi:hypothetical protein